MQMLRRDVRECLRSVRDGFSWYHLNDLCGDNVMYEFKVPFCNKIEDVPSIGILAYYTSNTWVLLLEEVCAAIQGTECAGNACGHF